MNQLGAYLLVSMMFVFAAMAEFAFVLFVKQKQAGKNIEDNCGTDGAKLNKISGYKVDKVSNLDTARNGLVQKIQNKKTRNNGFRSTKNTVLDDLHLTTNIDSAGFLIYCLGYLIFNFVYWMRVQN